MQLWLPSYISFSTDYFLYVVMVEVSTEKRNIISGRGINEVATGKIKDTLYSQVKGFLFVRLGLVYFVLFFAFQFLRKGSSALI